MSKKNRYLSLLLCLYICASGCKKEVNDNTEATFVNRINQTVTLDIYENEQDYKNGTNLFLRKTLPASDKILLPGNTFAKGKMYYMDWYTDDYVYNNWFNDAYNSVGTSYVTISPETGKNTFYTDDLFKGRAREAYLDKTQAATSWKAVDAFLFSESVGFLSKWDELTDEERHRMVVVQKDFVAAYESKSKTGEIQKQNLAVKVHHSQDAYIEFYNDKGQVVGQMISGRLPSGTAPEYRSNSTDTVLALLPGDLDYSFLMVKQ